MSPSTEQSLAVRRFNLGDALLLIAALAVALSLLSEWFSSLPVRLSSWISQIKVFWESPTWALNLDHGSGQRVFLAQFIDALFVQLLGDVLLVLTVLQPILRLRSPRPSLRELVRQSGFVVCVAVIVGTLILVDLWYFAIIPDSPVIFYCPVLLLLWPILALPPWNAEASWIDRLGRAVGSGWIVAIASATAVGFLFN